MLLLWPFEEPCPMLENKNNWKLLTLWARSVGKNPFWCPNPMINLIHITYEGPVVGGFLLFKKKLFTQVKCVTTETRKEEKELFFSLDVPGYWHAPLLTVCPPGNVSNLNLKTTWDSYRMIKRKESRKCYITNVKNIIPGVVG